MRVIIILTNPQNSLYIRFSSYNVYFKSNNFISRLLKTPPTYYTRLSIFNFLLADVLQLILYLSSIGA